MPPLPTIGNCVRVTLNWSDVQGVTPRNVLHLITASVDGEEIGAALDEVFTEYPDAFQTISTSALLQSYSILPLDGSSATQEVQSVGTDIVGGASGETIPAAAAVISFRTNQRGPRGRGRLYLGPMGEGALANGIVVESYRNSAVSSWQAIAADLPASPIAASLGVASYVHAEVGGVSSISMRAPAGTVRRRQNQLV